MFINIWCSATKTFPTLCNPVDYSMQGYVLHHVPEFAQTQSLKLMVPSSAACFLSCPQSFPESGSFPMSQLFASDSESIKTSPSVLPMNIQGQFPLGLTGLILLSKGLSRVFSSTTVRKHTYAAAHTYIHIHTYIHTYMLSCVQPCVTPWTVAHQAPLSMGFSSQEYWSGLPCPPPEKVYILAHYKCLFY